MTGKRQDRTPLFKVKEADDEKSVSHQSLRRLWSKMSEKLFLKHLKDKKVIRISQHGFAKGR